MSCEKKQRRSCKMNENALKFWASMDSKQKEKKATPIRNFRTPSSKFEIPNKLETKKQNLVQIVGNNNQLELEEEEKDKLLLPGICEKYLMKDLEGSDSSRNSDASNIFPCVKREEMLFSSFKLRVRRNKNVPSKSKNPIPVPSLIDSSPAIVKKLENDNQLELKDKEKDKLLFPGSCEKYLMKDLKGCDSTRNSYTSNVFPSVQREDILFSLFKLRVRRNKNIPSKSKTPMPVPVPSLIDSMYSRSPAIVKELENEMEIEDPDITIIGGDSSFEEASTSKIADDGDCYPLSVTKPAFKVDHEPSAIIRKETHHEHEPFYQNQITYAQDSDDIKTVIEVKNITDESEVKNITDESVISSSTLKSILNENEKLKPTIAKTVSPCPSPRLKLFQSQRNSNTDERSKEVELTAPKSTIDDSPTLISLSTSNLIPIKNTDSGELNTSNNSKSMENLNSATRISNFGGLEVSKTPSKTDITRHLLQKVGHMEVDLLQGKRAIENLEAKLDREKRERQRERQMLSKQVVELKTQIEELKLVMWKLK